MRNESNSLLKISLHTLHFIDESGKKIDRAHARTRRTKFILPPLMLLVQEYYYYYYEALINEL